MTAMRSMKKTIMIVMMRKKNEMHKYEGYDTYDGGGGGGGGDEAAADADVNDDGDSDGG